MSIIEVVSPGDRRSLIKRYERKTKSEAIRELIDLHFCNLQQIELLEGIKPSPPQRPPEDYGLPRYGLRWNGPDKPLSVPMKDGYWTPWHLTAQLQAENEALRMGAAQRQPIARYFHASGHVDPFPKSTEGKRYRLVEGTPGPTAGTEPCVHEFIPFTNGCSKCGEPYTYTTSSEAEDLLAATSLEFGERLEALEQERDILRKDAERYQWLRERDLETLHRGGVFAGQTPQNIVLNGETLDEAIDAAISKRVEQPRDCNCGACPAGCLSQVAP